MIWFCLDIVIRLSETHITLGQKAFEGSHFLNALFSSKSRRYEFFKPDCLIPADTADYYFLNPQIPSNMLAVHSWDFEDPFFQRRKVKFIAADFVFSVFLSFLWDFFGPIF